MVQRGLVEDWESFAGQVGTTGMGGGSEASQSIGGSEGELGVLAPAFEGTRWTHADVRTLSSIATFLVAVIALWEVARHG